MARPKVAGCSLRKSVRRQLRDAAESEAWRELTERHLDRLFRVERDRWVVLRGVSRRLLRAHGGTQTHNVWDLVQRDTVLDDLLGYSQRRIRCHLNVPQMPSLEAELLELSRTIPWWVITKDATKQKVLEQMLVFRRERLFRSRIQQANGRDRGRRV